MNVLVTGGAGYVGSAVVADLLASGASAVVVDDLSEGHRGAVPDGAAFVEGKIEDRSLIEHTIREHSIHAVIHMAASCLVGESVADPAAYYKNNVSAGLDLLEAMRGCSVERIVFSSSAAVYGTPERSPIREEDPARPINPYGETKRLFEGVLDWYGRAYGIRHASLRYFNAAGATSDAGEDHEPETHLIPLVLRAALGRIGCVEIYGDDYPTPDGTCIRDYIHVADLARAHVLALGTLDSGNTVYNLGGGRGSSIREVIDAAREVTSRPIPEKTIGRRPGDPAVLVASSDRARSDLGWRAEQSELGSIIESAWRWQKEHPSGYEDD